MANPEHLKVLKQGVEVWNRWRQENPNITPDLNGSMATRFFGKTKDSSELGLSGVDLSGANFKNAYLTFADLTNTNCRAATFSDANLLGASLSGADLWGANFFRTYAEDIDLTSTNLVTAELRHTDLTGSDLSNADLSRARMGHTILEESNLSFTRGLDSVFHDRASIIGISTLYKTQNEIPERFLRGCGLPEAFIVQIPALIKSIAPIQFYSCFISYSHKDEDFARRLFSEMRDAGLRVWFAPEEMKGGRKLHEQIFKAIQLHDKLLLVLSENSLQSEWVTTEIRRARKAEREENRRKLFPIRLVDFEAIREWECFDADSGKDLAVELREYFIPDFSNWKDHDAFEAAFDRLLRDLKAEEKIV